MFTVVIPLDTLGLGLATAFSQWLFFGVQAAYYVSGKSQLRFSLKSCRWQDAPEIVRRGYSGALSRFVEMFRCIVVNMLILKYVGEVGLSSFAASNSFSVSSTASIKGGRSTRAWPLRSWRGTWCSTAF